ncbi:asparagine synthase (glutamine-hydrolyzing) [Candidatus Solirubrobacter pratensis]|uniref:asparagine synthase (glutamine-hydrolyzing) n=1 Tax=Candidatus Solirubrobacter pratensis TaxID=1298857 RepID=UPI0003F564D8|nr:asparagine synthase (glutamine-hydrolyzing) [Candidatus Solirubrobacter pratensis]
MCGICGIAATGAVDAGALRAMSAALAHRGPDAHGEAALGPVALDARRLAIIDLEHGDQPIATEDGAVTVVQNGEIYNHAALRRVLEARGHRFRTRCDTEVIGHLYEQDGLAAFEQLRGMFAIALWDARARRLVLARDRFGIKPLFHARLRDGGLAFASELSALALAPGFPRELDPVALEAYLAFNSIPAPMTAYAAARKLPAGHWLTWDAEDGRVEIARWCRPRPVSMVRSEPGDVLAAELRARLRDSVRAHLVADVPVGVLLSGGIDSSALTALAAQESGQPVQTFSIGFRERSFDELERARLVARSYGTDHHELVVGPDAAELLPVIAAACDEPLGDSSALPTYLVSRLAAGHVKVVLSGEGGDELFGGYETYAAGLLAARFGRAARALSPVVERLPSGNGRVPLDYKLKRFTRAAHLPPLEAHQGFKEIFGAEQRRALLGAAGGDPLAAHRARWAETEGAAPLARLQDLDLGIYLVDDLLLKTDRMSMAHSLEARVPFLDAHVAELALALRTRDKVRGLAKKRLLRRAVAPLLPRQVVHGRKRGFSIPAAAWLRGPLLPFAREVLSPARLRAQSVLDATAAGQVLERHAAGREDMSRQLWGLMALSLWLDGRRG